MSFTPYKRPPGFGHISGFQAERVRSAWPDVVVGKKLTDKRIAHYEAQGYYGAEAKAARLGKMQAKAKVKETRAKRLARLLRKYH